MLYDRISKLAEKQKISLPQLAETLGLSRNAIYQWKNSSPKAETLEKVADYFGVTTDYLLGRTDKPFDTNQNTSETDLEKMLDNAMSFDGKPMSDHDKEVILAFLKGKFNK